MAKMVSLLTGWLTIGTSGPTVDGRTIKPEWLEQAAENYDPDEYTAVANAEHWFGNYGTVRELRTIEDKKKRVALQARIRPNKYYLQQNSEDLRLFFSMELTHNFAKTGKTYLTGLATTDNPASLGTSEAHFSREDNEDVFRGGSEEFSIESLQPAEDIGSEKSIVAGVIKGLKDVFTNHNNNNQREDFSMTEEQFNEFKKGQDNLTAAVTNLCGILNPENSGEGGEGAGGENLNNGNGNQGGGAQTPENNDFGKKIDDAVDKLNASLDALGKKLDDAVDGKFGKKTPKNTGSEDDKTFV